MQETNGGGKGSREAGRESTYALTAGRGPRQGSISDDGVRASGWRAGVQSGQAIGVGDRADPSGGPVGLPLRSAAAPRRADLLKRDDDTRDSRRVNISARSRVLSLALEIGDKAGGRIGTLKRSFATISIYIPFFYSSFLINALCERNNTHSPTIR